MRTPTWEPIDTAPYQPTSLGWFCGRKHAFSSSRLRGRKGTWTVDSSNGGATGLPWDRYVIQPEYWMQAPPLPLKYTATYSPRRACV